MKFQNCWTPWKYPFGHPPPKIYYRPATGNNPSDAHTSSATTLLLEITCKRKSRQRLTNCELMNKHVFPNWQDLSECMSVWAARTEREMHLEVSRRSSKSAVNRSEMPVSVRSIFCGLASSYSAAQAWSSGFLNSTDNEQRLVCVENSRRVNSSNQWFLNLLHIATSEKTLTDFN